MKYIKLFEAYESQVITSAIKFLTKNVDQYSANSFSNELKKLMKDYDFPISKISEDDIKYYKTSKAIKVKNTKPINNRLDIYCIKFWFSLEKGFLGKTAVSDLRTPYIPLKNDYSTKNSDFNEEQLEYIKDELGITKGKLVSVLDYMKLKTGDTVLCTLGDKSSKERRIAKGQIFVDNDAIFIYNDYKSDSVSPDNRPDFANNYSYNFRLGRIISNNFEADGDHFKLHLYIKDKQELRQENKADDVKHRPNLADYNKPMNNDGDVIDWNLHNQFSIKDVIKDSDFAIILYLDRLLSIPDTYSIKRSREGARKGATALMSDYDIKQININNYMSKLINKFGIEKETIDFSKLGNLVNSINCHKFILIHMYSRNNASALTNIIEPIYCLITEPEYDQEYYFNRVISEFSNYKKSSNQYTKIYKENLDAVLNSGDEKLIAIVQRVLKIGENINNYILNTDIENIHDLLGIRYKLDTILNFMFDSKNKLSTCYQDILGNFETGGIKKYISYCDGVEEEYDETMEKLDIIERFINSMLK